MSYALEMQGSVGSDPAKVTESAALSKAIDLCFRAQYDAVFGDGITIASTDLAPFTPQLGAIAAVRAVAVRAVDGQSLVVKLTSGKGVDQQIPVSDVLLVQAKNEGDEYTAVKIVGTGRIEYLLAGNVTP